MMVQEKTKDGLNRRIVLRKRLPVWKALKVQGDVKILAELQGVSRNIISLAVNRCEGSLRILNAVDAYYEDREVLLHQL